VSQVGEGVGFGVLVVRLTRRLRGGTVHGHRFLPVLLAQVSVHRGRNGAGMAGLAVRGGVVKDGVQVEALGGHPGQGLLLGG
jgi:hypothetical protein